MGTCVVIDVFRACSVMYYVAGLNPRQIIISNSYEEIGSIKKQNPGAIVIGRNHHPPDNLFNVSNSPSEVMLTNMKDKTVIMHSEGGVNGMILANSADEVIAGGFINARAITNYLQAKNSCCVTLLSVGILGMKISIEDNLCTEYIKSLIDNSEYDFEKSVIQIKETSGAKFFTGDCYYPTDDFHLCMDVNKFDFVLKREKCHNYFVLKKIAM